MIVEQPETFATLLRRARRAAGLTQEALVERSGLSVRGIQDLERGMTHPLRDTVARFDRALGLAGADRAAFARAGASRPPARERQRAADATRHGLPAGVTSFIGREWELETLRRLVATTRLLTLTGPGGAGKTRLALETAHQALPEYRDGVAWVELAPLVDPALAPQTVAASLGVQEQPGEALLTTLQGALRSRNSCSSWTTASTCSTPALSWSRLCCGLVPNYGCSPPVGKPSASPASVPGRCLPWPCRRKRQPLSWRSGPPPYSSSWSGRRR